MAQKKCSKCGQWKDESEFSWHFIEIKRHSSCSECRKEYQRGYYQSTKEDFIEEKTERLQDVREAARHYVFQYLQAHPCDICGETDPYVLIFHHVSGKKKMNVSQMVNQGVFD